jgi:predicted transcriptional regulator
MDPEQSNKDVMMTDFSTIGIDSNLREAFEGIQKGLEKSLCPFGLIVIDYARRYAGVLTIDDFMKELRQLYRDACDKPGGKEWMSRFFNECEIMGIKKVSEIMSVKRLSVRPGEGFEKSCELVLRKKLTLLAVVDEQSKPVGIITRRQVLAEIGSRMFK